MPRISSTRAAAVRTGHPSWWRAGYLTAVLAFAPLPVLAQSAATYTFQVPAEALSTALTRIAAQAGARLVADATLTRGRTSAPVQGTLSLDQALAQALAGSGLRHRLDADGVITLEEARAPVEMSPVVVSGRSPAEDALGPVRGLSATRSASATKTDTALLDTPQSISVVTSEELRERQAETLSQALGYTPGFTAQPTSFSRTADRFRIRGLDVESATAGSLRDGLRLQVNSYDGIQEPYGLERVEVIRGAASVLYGQLSPGGMVNTVSKRPTADPLGEVNLQLGSYRRRQVSADVGGPVSDDERLTYRFTVLARDSDTPQDDIDDRRLYIAPAVTWRPDASTELTLLSYYQRTNTRFAAPLPYQMVEGIGSGPYFIDRHTFVGEPSYDRMNGETFAVGYELNHDFSDQVKLRHKLRTYDARMTWDYLQINPAPAAVAQAAATGVLQRRYSDRRERARNLTADVNLESSWHVLGAKHTVLAGVDAYRTVYDSHNFRGAAPSLNLSNPVYGVPVTVNHDPSQDRGSRITTVQAGLYLQDQIHIGEHWSVLLGGRRDWVRQSQTEHRNDANSRQNNAATTWRAGLVYKTAAGLAPYFSYSESFFPVSVTSSAGQSFQPTQGRQYEVGIRYQPEGSDLLISAALFDLEQSNVLKYDGTTDTYSQTGRTRSRGLELEARATLGPALSVIASYTYTDARITRSSIPSEIGQRTEDTPFNQAALWLDYRFTALGLPGLTAGLGGRYLGTTRASDIPSKIPAYFLVDLRAAYDFDPHWSLALNASNLANRQYVQCDYGSCRYGDERRISATLSYRW